MDGFDSYFGTAIVIAVGIVAFVALLLGTLYYLGVPRRLLLWTLLAHVLFVLVMGLAVYSQPVDRRALQEDAIHVVMLPPIEEKSEEEPFSTPAAPEEQVKIPPKNVRITPPAQLPRNAEGASASSRFIGNPFPERSAATMGRTAAQSLDPESFASRGFPIRRPEPGEIGGTSLDAPRTFSPRIASEDASSRFTRIGIGNRPRPGLPSSKGSERVAPPGAGSSRGPVGALPKGVSFSGQVRGRRLEFFPEMPTVRGKEGGEVALRFWVTPDGRVFNVQVIKKSGDPNLERVARDLVERIKFAPLDPAVEPIRQWGDITIAFRREL